MVYFADVVWSDISSINDSNYTCGSTEESATENTTSKKTCQINVDSYTMWIRHGDHRESWNEDHQQWD